jgi:hypothetical protein
MLVVVIGVVRQALALLEDTESMNGDYTARSLYITSMYGGAPPGTSVPPFDARSPSGEIVPSRQLFHRRLVCVFFAAGCAPCKMLLSELAVSSWNGDAPLVVFTDDASDVRYASLPPNVAVLEQLDGTASKAFRSNAFPQAFAVDEQGVIVAVAVPNSLEELRILGKALMGGDRRRTTAQTAAA